MSILRDLLILAAKSLIAIGDVVIMIFALLVSLALAPWKNFKKGWVRFRKDLFKKKQRANTYKYPQYTAHFKLTFG